MDGISGRLEPDEKHENALTSLAPNREDIFEVIGLSPSFTLLY
jgi:hypothetical protein